MEKKGDGERQLTGLSQDGREWGLRRGGSTGKCDAGARCRGRHRGGVGGGQRVSGGMGHEKLAQAESMPNPNDHTKEKEQGRKEREGSNRGQRGRGRGRFPEGQNYSVPEKRDIWRKKGGTRGGGDRLGRESTGVPVEGVPGRRSPYGKEERAPKG